MSPEPEPVAVGLSAPLAPILTIARNFGIGTYAVLGAFCLLVLPLGWAPMPNALLPLFLGAALLIGSIVMAFRRVPLVRRAEKAAAAGGARSSFAFLQSQFIGDSRRTGDWSAPGFVLVWDDRLEIDFRRESLGAGAPREQRSIRFDEISDIFAREATSMSYRKLAILLTSGEEILFTLAPRSGSGLRGPSDEETEGAIAELRGRLEASDAAAITLDYTLLRDTELANVVWYEVGAASLRYDCFLGDVRFVIGGVDMSAEWGWITLFDFALCMRLIADGLLEGKHGSFDFTESGATIEFIIKGGQVAVTAEHASGTGIVAIGAFRRAAESMLDRVRAKIEGDHPDLLRNPHYRQSLGDYW